jgi:hypothetical protein
MPPWGSLEVLRAAVREHGLRIDELVNGCELILIEFKTPIEGALDRSKSIHNYY